jgi:hypothetical protein
MLHQTTYLMHTSQKISCVNGPWWFVQMWCWRCILVHLACSLHFGLDLIMELTRH